MNKLNYTKISAFLVSVIIIFIPVFILSAAQGGGNTITNPLKSAELKDILLNIMNIVASVGAVVVVFFIIYSGFKFVTAGSSDADRTKAKEIFYSTIIGGAILLGADVIANVVVNTVKTTTGTK